MKSQIFLSILLVVFSLIAVACGAQQTGEAAPEGSDRAALDRAGLIEALRASGSTVELGEAIQQEFFSVDGQILKVDGSDVQVFEYASAEAMESDAGQVSPDGGSIGTSMVTWIGSPHFFKAGRVLVLYVGDDAAVLDLLDDALGTQFAGR